MTHTEPEKIDTDNTPIGKVTIDEQWFARVYDSGFKKTVRFLSSRGIDSDVALDLAQGAWTKAWERREQLRNPAFFVTWVNSIALNCYRSSLRKDRLMEVLGDRDVAGAGIHSAGLDAEKILNQCKPSERILLEGHYMHGLKLGEIAYQNNWSETAARIRLLRARKRLQELFVMSPKGCKGRRIKTNTLKTVPMTSAWISRAA